MTHAATPSLHAPLVVSSPVPTEPAPLHAFTARLARGEDPAWAEFHHEYGPALFRQLLAATRGDHDLANEALQRTYLRVARHVRPCNSEPMFRAWLRVVARSALQDCWRRRQSFWRLLTRTAAEPVHDESADEQREAELQAALEHALARLAADDRDLLDAKYLRGDSVRAIAERLGVSPKAVESRLTRARAELRQQLVSLRDELT